MSASEVLPQMAKDGSEAKASCSHRAHECVGSSAPSRPPHQEEQRRERLSQRCSWRLVRQEKHRRLPSEPCVAPVHLRGGGAVAAFAISDPGGVERGLSVPARRSSV